VLSYNGHFCFILVNSIDICLLKIATGLPPIEKMHQTELLNIYLIFNISIYSTDQVQLLPLHRDQRYMNLYGK
jgi:hypothetical protein